MYAQDSSKWEKAWIDEGVEFKELAPLPITPPYPKDNPYSKEKEKLGERLFNDPKLSLSDQIACANCHDKELGFSDGRSVSYGHNRALGKRNSISIYMSAFGEEKFWDGRAKSLEDQALMPIKDPLEMAFDPDKAAKKLNSIPSYKEEFKKAFGTSIITPTLIAKAIATYERSLMPKHNRFDKFLRGKHNALSDEEILGLHLFRTKARCANCHFGQTFSDYKYHNLGLTYYGRKKYEDFGRYAITHKNEDMGRFKTPSLRSIVKTSPYMHNGLFPHLEGVVNAYNAGMFHPKPNKKDDPLFPKTDSLLKPLYLSDEEKKALVSFLKTL